MQSLLSWLDQVGQFGTVTESDTKLSMELPERVLDDPEMTALLMKDDLPFRPEVFVEISPPIRSAPLLLSDVELPTGLVPCPRHEQVYLDISRQQEDERYIAPWSRLHFLRQMASCQDCSVAIALRIVIDKEQHWRNTRGTWPQNVDCRIWFYPEKVLEGTTAEQYLTWPPRPLVLAVRGRAPIQSPYVTCIDIATGDSVQRAAAAAAELAPMAEALMKQIKERPLLGADAERILPPDYWVNQDVLASGRFATDLMPLPGLLLIGLLGQVCNRVTREAGNTLLFQVEGARPMEVRCRLTAEGVLMDGAEWVMTPVIVGQLLHLYREAVHGKPQGQNLDLLQQAVRMAGDARLSSLITNPQSIEAYYDFQWKTLVKTRFKEQVDLVKSYLGAAQTARAKVSTAMDELFKNLTTVVSGAAAVAAVLLTAAVTKNDQIYDYLILTGALIAFPYIPIHLLRAISLVEAAEKELGLLEVDLDLSARELGFPLNVLDIEVQLKPSRTDLHRRVRTTAFWLGVTASLGLGTALTAFEFGQSSIEKLMSPWLVRLAILGSALIPTCMLVQLWRRTLNRIDQ